ncbi:MAG: PTS glucose transporter subunit IIA [Lachnospiraceae bacterium]
MADSKEKDQNQEGKALLPGGRIRIKSPVKGIVSRIERAPDQAFSQKKLGDGVLVYPARTYIVAPFDGKISCIPESNHAVGIKNMDGIEVLIHVGIDTVKFNGRGFNMLVAAGDEVKEGQHLLEFDRSHIRANAISDATPVVVTNMREGWKINILKQGNVEELEDIFEIEVLEK